MTTMRFAYGIPLSCPLNPALASVPALTTLARTAEDAGFGAGYVTEHPAPSQRWRESGGHDALDPFVALSVMSYSTTTLRLLTNLTVIPYRNPFLLAKASATVDVLSGGRLILGGGVGYLKSEFAALGIDFDTRNERVDEYLKVLKMAWTGEPVVFEGTFVTAKGNTAYPPTTQKPGPPIWLGGNSKLTRRRVAEVADGWMPMPVERGAGPGGVPLETLEDLVGLLRYLQDHADSVGRTAPIDIMCVLPPTAAADSATIDMIGRLAEVGVTWMAVNGRGETVAEATAFIEHFGSGVIGKL